MGEGREGGRKGGLSEGNDDFKARKNRKEKKRICRKGESKQERGNPLSLSNSPTLTWGNLQLLLGLNMSAYSNRSISQAWVMISFSVASAMSGISMIETGWSCVKEGGGKRWRVSG